VTIGSWNEAQLAVIDARLVVNPDGKRIGFVGPDGQISLLGLLIYEPMSGGNAGVFVMSPYDLVDPNLSNALVLTTSSAPYASKAGAAAKPLGVAGTNSDPAATADATKGTPWIADPDYVAGMAGVNTIVGGYDHVCNQLAGSIVGGGHNYIQYHVNGHSSIFGGANNRIDCGRSTILGGSSCTVNGGANVATIVGGEYNTCQGSRSAIIGGLNNTIVATAAYSGVVAGRSNTIASGVDYGAVISGQGNTVAHDYAVVLGQDGVSLGVGTLTLARTKLSVAGDAQTVIHEYAWRTTNATIANMTQFVQIDVTAKAALAIRAQMVAIDEASGACAIYSWDGGMIWDGAAIATFYDIAGSGANRNFVQVVDNIGVAALPQWSGTTGAVRPRVTGKAATNIKWSCTAVITATRL